MVEERATWDHYRTVLEVLRQGSLSGAARALGLTQPTVGRQVEALEQVLGTTLFSRSPGGLIPTDAARALRPYAEDLARTAAALHRAATETRTEISGSVRITASEVVGVEVLPPILTALRVAQPGLSLELVLSDANQDLLRREADVAVRMSAPRQGALLAKAVGRITLGFHAHRRYLDRVGVPTDWAALRAHTLVGYDQETTFIRDMKSDGLPVDRAIFAFRCDSGLGQLAAIRAGFGIGMCQVGLARRDPELVRLLPEIEPGLDTWIAMHEDLRAVPRCRAVFDALVQGMTAYVAAQG